MTISKVSNDHVLEEFCLDDRQLLRARGEVVCRAGTNELGEGDLEGVMADR